MDQQERFWLFYKSSMIWKDKLLKRQTCEFEKINDGIKLDLNKINLNNVDNLNEEKNDSNKLKETNFNLINLIEKNQSNEKVLEENFLEFIAKTRIHQTERKKIKEKLKLLEEKIEYKDITDFERKNLSVVEEPILRKDLYGNNADSIYLKEIKLQYNYNEFCDKYNPSFWPIIPINLNMKEYDNTI